MDTPMPHAKGFANLADLLSPLPVEEFFTSIKGKLPVHIQGPPDKFAFAMSWDLLNRMLGEASIWTPHTLQLVLDKIPIQPDQYAIPGFGRDGNPTQLVDLGKVRDLVRQGASLVFNEIETLTPGMKQITEILGRDPGGKIECNMYCSWQRHQAFDVHYDTHDVFAMQVVGEKVWRIYQRHFKDPINHPAFKGLDRSFHHAHKGPLLAEFTMRPGDLAYVPRGFYHEALAESDATLHMTFSVVPLIGLDVVTMLFEHGVLDEVFRQDVPRPADRDGKALDEYLMRLAGRVRETLRDPAFRAQLEKAIDEYRPRVQYINLPKDAGK